jgi:hypothetical protein
VCNGQAPAYSLALLHSTKSAIALLNEKKLLTLLHCQRGLVSAPVRYVFGFQLDVAIY